MSKPVFIEILEEQLSREGVNDVKGTDLIGYWSDNEINSVGKTLSDAFNSFVTNAPEMNIDGWQDITNQSKGNKVATLIIERITQHKSIIRCKGEGRGYPDEWLEINGVVYAIEMKSTAKFDENNTHRAVLLSSIKKLRTNLHTGLVNAPIKHAIIQTIYQNRGKKTPIVKCGKVYFLQPNSHVNARLEISSTQKLLTQTQNITFN